ncbi:hypothetical protein J437_LFUL005720, partial [Ladona fulva]
MILEVESFGKLLSDPSSGKFENASERVTCPYDNLCDRYKLKAKEFGRQFCHLYSVRLSKMREIIVQKSKAKWGTNVKVCKLFELQEGDNEKSVVIGTLFKHQELKPSILKEISEEHNLLPQPKRSNFTGDDDILILEDDIQRIRLIGNIDVHNAVTGILCAVYGNENEDGQFVVEDFCWAGPPDVDETSLPQSLSTSREASYVLFISGLDISSLSGDSLLPMQLLADWVCGMVGEPSEQQEHLCKIVRVIIAGNSISGKSGSQNEEREAVNAVDSQRHGVTGSLKALKTFDDFLVQLVASVPVDLMPGEFDPSNHLLPQQPFHFCMLPQSTLYPTLNEVTNPYMSRISGKLVLGTSGQPVDDIIRFSRMEDPLTVLKSTLNWAHLTPTCPDTLR